MCGGVWMVSGGVWVVSGSVWMVSKGVWQMPGGYQIENRFFLHYWVKIDQKISQKLFSAPKMTKNRNLVFVGGFLDRIKKFKKLNMFL